MSTVIIQLLEYANKISISIYSKVINACMQYTYLERDGFHLAKTFDKYTYYP